MPLPVLGLGAAGVLAFSFTLPATRAALPAFGAVPVGLGRAVGAALLAAVCLGVVRPGLPTARQVRGCAVVALGVVVGFPLFSALALRDVGATHGAILVGLLPIATAAAAVFRAGERPPPAFWLAAVAGLAAVLGYAVVQGAGRLRPADLLLLLAVAAGAVGYAEGGRLARELPGWQVISWALLLAVPILLPVTAYAWIRHPPHAVGPAALAGLGYVTVVSMFLGFVAWYRALARGGVARVGQLQLAQPVLTAGWSWLLLGERIGAPGIVAALLVLATTAATQWVRIGVPPAPPAPGRPGAGRPALPASDTMAACAERAGR